MNDLRGTEAALETSYSPPWRPPTEQRVLAKEIVPLAQLLRPIEAKKFTNSLHSKLQNLRDVNLPIPHAVPNQLPDLLADRFDLQEHGVNIDDFKHAVDHIFNFNSTKGDLN